MIWEKAKVNKMEKSKKRKQEQKAREENLVFKGVTRKNSITFEFNEEPSIGVKSTLEADGSIRTERVDILLEEFKEEIALKSATDYAKPFKKFRIFFYLNIIVVGFLLTYFLDLNMLVSAMTLTIVDLILYHGLFTKYIFSVGISFKDKNIKKMKGLHSAEHMVINAYNDLKKVPTREEVRRYSKFSPYCSAVTEYKSVFQFPLYLLLYGFQTSETGLVKILLMFAISFVAWIPNIYQLFGWYVLRKPTDKEIDVAVDGIKAYDLLRREFLNNPMKVICEIKSKSMPEIKNLPVIRIVIGFKA
jgi:hypothetical protein